MAGLRRIARRGSAVFRFRESLGVAPTIPTEPPSYIVAGTTVKYTRVLSTFPASEGWTMKAALRGVSAIEATVSESAGTHTVTFAAVETETLEPGRYQLAEWVEGAAAYAGEQYEVGRYAIQVTPSAESAEAGELQSQSERDLAAVNAVIAGRLTSDIESYTIAGRSVTKMPIGDLMALRTRLEWAVWRERNPNQLGPHVRGRFVA